MLKDWNFWERNFAECVLAVYRLPSSKFSYKVFNKVTNKWPREYKSRFWTFCYRLSRPKQDVFVMNIIKLIT